MVFLQEVKCTPCSQLALQIRLKSQCSFQGSPSGNITSSKGFHNLFSPYSQNGVFSNSSAGMLGGVPPCCCMFLPSILLHSTPLSAQFPLKTAFKLSTRNIPPVIFFCYPPLVKIIAFFPSWPSCILVLS